MLLCDDLRAYCLTQKGATEDFPFGENPAVFKVMGKMFALVALDEVSYISLKVDPIESLILQQTYPQITPGYHLNKKHWITIQGDESLPDELVESLIDDAYALVVKSLPRADRDRLQQSNQT